ncbi:type IV pilin [Halorarius litoreus]|uniref:type IV pilin n=1 Tax=Halorarius litoreus TaxID=2962676 RepID=UPI0020CC61B8|nr:type IV pilin N-terminal domain-containing protein [Halorarius litoreus]
MQLKQLFDGDERGATPVIGIVLMVAIAVILAALVSTEALALGRHSAEAGPSAVIQFDYDASVTGTEGDAWGRDNTGGTYDGQLTISHEGGEAIPVGRLTLVGVDGTELAFSQPSGVGTHFDAGDELTVWVHEDDTVRIVWDSREGTKSTAVAVWEGA